MAANRGRIRQSAFTTGVVSPLVSSARMDLEKYSRACQELDNFILLPQGGVRRRPGFSFVAPTKATPDDGEPRLVPFVFSTEQAYILEFGESGGDGYIRFYKDNGRIEDPPGTAYEIESPYLAEHIHELDFEQSADTLYIVHGDFPPHKLTRSGHTDWRLREIAFRPVPTFEADTTLPGASISLGAVTGNGIIATASSPIFVVGDPGRQIKYGEGRAVITLYTSTTQVTVDILDDFPGTLLPDGDWVLTGSPNSELTPSKKGPVGSSVRLTSDNPATVFRTSDVGKYIKIQDGIVKINAFNASNEVRGIILLELSTATMTTAWSMEVDAWSDTEGYPVAVAFSPGDRLCFAKDQRVWGSVVGDYENMGVSTLDDAAFEFGLNIGQVSVAQWLMGSKELVCGSVSGEHVLFGGGTDEVLTPTSVRQRVDTDYGSKKIRPTRAGPALLFVDASGREIREHVYSFEEDRHVAPSMTLLAEHLFPVGTTITAMAYQRTPWSVLWCRRSDGMLLGLTYLRAEDVIGWHRHPLTGEDGVVSLAVIPHPDADREQLWVIASRVIGGDVTYYVEYLNDTSIFEDPNGVNFGARGLDSSLTYEGPVVTAISGLDHLEGRTVAAIADGGYVGGAFTVVNGDLTPSLDVEAAKVEVGLMFNSVLTPVEWDEPGLKKSSGPLHVRLVNTLGLVYTGGDDHPYEIEFRDALDPIGVPPPLFTGTKDLTHIGWGDGTVTFRQQVPLPCTITLIAGVLGVGE